MTDSGDGAPQGGETGEARGAGDGPDSAGGRSDGTERRFGLRRAVAWARRHGPETLIGAVVVAAVGAGVPVLLTAAIGGDDESGRTTESASPSGESKGGAATAPTCSGEACAGLDPKETGCGTGAKTLAEEWAGAMHLEIRFSPRCRTAWGKLTGSEIDDTVEIQTSPTRRQMAKVVSGHTKYTPMLAVPKDFSLQATAVAVNTSVAREVATGHVMRIGADEGDLSPSTSPSL
ncbi:DUF2690 domain-containing protein [Streptomyces sp. NPDC092952]|uniref:DUF2690 domain-containing protein n=1 Tax=Streptomyces sp. NPDC092952 TaxID=3366018 RepID=UPI003829DD91